MQAFRRPPAAAVVPVLAFTAAAALLFLVAFSIALQPPNTADTGVIGRILAWARAVLFSAGVCAFLVGLAAFARTQSRDNEADDAEAGVVAVAPSPLSRTSSTATTDSFRPRRDARPLAARQAWTARDTTRFTLIALGPAEDDVRAIADFTGAAPLLDATRTWRWRYPDEELRIFGPDGTLLARRTAVLQRAAPPAPAPARAQQSRRRLALGGVR